MLTTIDEAGRIVVPKALRDLLGLHGGQELTVEARDGQLVIEPTPVDMRLAEDAAGPYAVTDREMPTLATAQVRANLEQTRRWGQPTPYPLPADRVIRAQPQTAPWAADPTSLAYFASTPVS